MGVAKVGVEGCSKINTSEGLHLDSLIVRNPLPFVGPFAAEPSFSSQKMKFVITLSQHTIRYRKVLQLPNPNYLMWLTYV